MQTKDEGRLKDLAALDNIASVLQSEVRVSSTFSAQSQPAGNKIISIYATRPTLA